MLTSLILHTLAWILLHEVNCLTTEHKHQSKQHPVPLHTVLQAKLGAKLKTVQL